MEDGQNGEIMEAVQRPVVLESRSELELVLTQNQLPVVPIAQEMIFKPIHAQIIHVLVSIMSYMVQISGLQQEVCGPHAAYKDYFHDYA